MKKKIFTTAMLSCFLGVAFCQTGAGKVKNNNANLSSLTTADKAQKKNDQQKLQQATVVPMTPDRQAAADAANKLKKTAAQHN